MSDELVDDVLVDDEVKEDGEVKEYEGPYSETEGKEVKIPLYNANHGKVPRDGGPYMDDLAAIEAEKWRAKVEDREPDLDNPPPTAATRLVPKHELVERDTDKAHYSEFVEVKNEPVSEMVVDTSSAFDADPDPHQVDWNNDASQVAAMEAKAKFDEASKSTSDDVA